MHLLWRNVYSFVHLCCGGGGGGDGGGGGGGGGWLLPPLKTSCIHIML